MSAHLEAVCIGRETPTTVGRLKTTGIDKRPVLGPWQIGDFGLEGDCIVDDRHHGGRDQAVYAFAREDYHYWERELGRTFAPGSFGENLTTVGLDVTNARIGDRWQIGEVILEVADVRIPCATFAAFLGEDKWVSRFTERGAPGAYLRTIAPGRVCAGDRIDVVQSRDHDLTVGLAFRAQTTEKSLIARFSAEPRAAAKLLEKAERARA